MKKLTAGIFATILGLTAMGAADAAVTSKGYVDAAINAVNTEVAKKVDTTTYTTDQGIQDGRIQALETNSATKKELSDGLDGKQDKLLTGTNVLRDDPDGQAAGNVITSITADDGVVKYTTANVATSQELTDLDARVTTAEGEIDDLQENSATKTELQQGLAGKVDNTTYTTDQGVQDGRIQALETNSATKAELKEETDARTEADEELQKAIEAIEGGVGEIESAGIGNDGQYALTMLKNGDTITYKWERIDRAYDAGDLGEDEGNEIYADPSHQAAN